MSRFKPIARHIAGTDPLEEVATSAFIARCPHWAAEEPFAGLFGPFWVRQDTPWP